MGGLLPDFWRVTVVRTRYRREGTTTRQQQTRVNAYCRGEEQALDTAGKAMASRTHPGKLERILIVPITEREYTKHTHSGY